MRVGAVLIHDVTRGKCAWFPEIRRIDDDDNVGRVWVSIEECESRPCHCVPVLLAGPWRVHVAGHPPLPLGLYRYSA